MSKTIARIKIEGVIEKECESYNQKWLLETIEKLTKDKKKLGGVIRTVVCEKAGSFALVDMTPAEIGERMEKYL